MKSGGVGEMRRERKKVKTRERKKVKTRDNVKEGEEERV